MDRAIIPSSRFVTTEDNITIAFDHYEAGRDHVIILAPGFYNSKNAVLFRQMSADLTGSFDVIAMDFRGHGNSGGRFSFTSREYLDLAAVLRYARRTYGRIGVIGFSLGAATSIITAAKAGGIDSLIAVSPPSAFRAIECNVWHMGIRENIIYNVFQEGRIGKGCRWGPWWQPKARPIDMIEAITIPVFFIAGGKDWLIHPRHARLLYKKKRGAKKIHIFEEGTHAEYIYRRFGKEAIRSFREWFSETLSS